MATQLDPGTFADLNVSNHLIGNPQGLAGAWDRDGYWFFRDVLDRDAVAALRGVYVEELSHQGVLDPGDPLARYNGAPFDAAAFRNNLRYGDSWKTFVEHPAVHAFFRQLLGDEPHWIANIVNRGTPPAAERDGPRTLFIHQDGVFNRGIPFYVTWVPLATITADMGGVALAEGLHDGTVLHRMEDEVYVGITPDQIAADRWRHSEYRPGDLLMMDVMTPHTGLTNVSDRFRFSIDLRVMRESGNQPVIGTVAAISDESITVRTDAGEARFALDENTYCRGLNGKRLKPADIPSLFKVGSPALVAQADGRAVMIRPPH